MKFVRDKLDQGKAISLGLYVRQPDNSGFADHGVAISNYRQKCCGNLCITFYQVIDSLGLYWKGDPQDDWIEEDELAKFIFWGQPVTWLDAISENPTHGPAPSRGH